MIPFCFATKGYIVLLLSLIPNSNVMLLNFNTSLYFWHSSSRDKPKMMKRKTLAYETFYLVAMLLHEGEAFSDPSQISFRKLIFFLRKQLTALWTCFAKIVNGWRLLTIFAKKLHKAFNFFCKALHLRGLTGFLMRLCKKKQQNARDFLS